jgi:hypothetical protein
VTEGALRAFFTISAIALAVLAVVLGVVHFAIRAHGRLSAFDLLSAHTRLNTILQIR